MFGATHFSKATQNGDRNNAVNKYWNVNKYLTIHQRNLLVMEIFKTENNLNSNFMKDISLEKYCYYSLRNQNHLQLPKVRTTIYGTEKYSV